MKKLFIVPTAIISFVISCSPKTIAPTKEIPIENNLAQGKQIFENSCAKCHDLPDPKEFSSVDWVGIMNSMAPQAKLTDLEHQWVYKYIISLK